MAVSIPDGYLTRPAASRIYNRSQRALERDLEDAYLFFTWSEDEEEWLPKVEEDEEGSNTKVEEAEVILNAFRLYTNDGVERRAQKVTTALVNKLKKESKNPQWGVDTEWLESKFGRKGSSPKPAQPETTDSRGENGPRDAKPDEEVEKGTSDEQSVYGALEYHEIDRMYLPDDVEFLKERIRRLEREKLQENRRHEETESKLFAQLKVKDGQISAWDDITQGLTKGLATGRITPTNPGNSIVPVSKPEDTSSGSTITKQAESGTDVQHPVIDAESVTSKTGKEDTTSPTNTRQQKAKVSPKKSRQSKPKKANSRKQKARPKTQQKAPTPKWQRKQTKKAPAKKAPTPPTIGQRISRFFR